MNMLKECIQARGAQGIDMDAEHILFELALANLTAGLDYLQLIRSKKAAGIPLTWEDVDAAIARNEAMRAQFETARRTSN